MLRARLSMSAAAGCFDRARKPPMKALTATEMREVDRLTTERYGIPSLQMMEAAGKNVADAILRDFSPALPQRVTVLCGKGNNGGDGLVAPPPLKAAGGGLRGCPLWGLPGTGGGARRDH